jgi:two-component system OmpR family response regulator
VRVLIVEDHVKLASLVRRGLRGEGIAADVASTGEDALWMAQAAEYDAIILDLMLPGVDGIEVCRRLRAKSVWAPILILTSRDAVRDRVAGLDGGADDYVTKPFSFAELLARLRALARRGRSERPAELRVGGLRMDPAARRAWRGDVPLELTAKEFAILEIFMRRPGDVVSRLELLEHAWDYAYENRSNIIDAYVRLLRLKIDRPSASSRSRRCAGPDTGYARTAALEPHPDQASRHRGVRRRDGARRGGRGPPYLPSLRGGAERQRRCGAALQGRRRDDLAS